jgi:hypothetical protein
VFFFFFFLFNCSVVVVARGTKYTTPESPHRVNCCEKERNDAQLDDDHHIFISSLRYFVLLLSSSCSLRRVKWETKKTK